MMFQKQCGNRLVYSDINKLKNIISQSMKENDFKLPFLLSINARLLLSNGQFKKAKDDYVDKLTIDKDFRAYINILAYYLQIGEVELASDLFNYGNQLFEDYYRYRVDWTNLGMEFDRYRLIIHEELN